MEGEEEWAGTNHGMGGDESQTEAAADATSRNPERSQTPDLNALGSVGGSDADDDKEEDREEQTTGSLWGHTRLPPSVYGNNPPSGGKRVSKAAGGKAAGNRRGHAGKFTDSEEEEG